ncbi:hypothetical protein CsSME_00053955 [Camellia sinensis var. sinensis]
MAGVTEDPPIVADQTTPRDDFTPRNMLGPENITARRALNFDLVAQTSPSTLMHEIMQMIMDQTKQNEQRLKNMMAENERLHQDLALEVTKSQQAACQDGGQPRGKEDGR